MQFLCVSIEQKCKRNAGDNQDNFVDGMLAALLRNGPLLAVFSRDFRVGGRKLRVAGTWQSSALRARVPSGVRGHAPPENF